MTLEVLRLWGSIAFMIWFVYWILPFEVKISYKPHQRPREISMEQQLFIQYLVSKLRGLYDNRYWVLFILSLIGVPCVVSLYLPGYGVIAFPLYLLLWTIIWSIYRDFRSWVKKQEARL